VRASRVDVSKNVTRIAGRKVTACGFARLSGEGSMVPGCRRRFVERYDVPDTMNHPAAAMTWK
jgi:hypothetical protein